MLCVLNTETVMMLSQVIAHSLIANMELWFQSTFLEKYYICKPERYNY